MKNRMILAAVAGGLAMAGSAQAAFVAVETFDTYAIGSNLSGQGGWLLSGTTSSATVVADPAGGDNRVLRYVTGGADADLSKAVSGIANDTTGTVFYRLRLGGTAIDFNMGLSDESQANIDAFNDLDANIGVPTGTPPPFRIRNGGGNASTGASLDTGTWYSGWHVINNSTDKQWVYLQKDGDATASKYDNGGANYDFRTNTGNGVAGGAFNVLALLGNAATDPVFVDAIYLDQAGENTANPVPEPASLGLAAVAGAMLLRRRR